MHGCSGHAGINIPDVPCLRDSSTCGGPGELHSAIVIHLADCVRSLAKVCPVFAIGIQSHHHPVSDSIGVVASSHVLSSIILVDELLLALFNALPIWLEVDIK